MSDGIRLADLADAEQMLAIYAPVIRDSAISFESEPPTLDELGGRVERTLLQWPWLVYEANGRVLGYAYASQFRAREAYQWTTEVTVYVDSTRHRGGVGRGLYTSLLACLSLQGYRLAIAAITLPNAASVGLHEHLGFRRVGVFDSVGYKLGRWHDVGFWQLALTEFGHDPSPPKSISDLVGTSAWNDAVNKGVVGHTA